VPQHTLQSGACFIQRIANETLQTIFLHQSFSLLGVHLAPGSVATIKLPQLCQLLLQLGEVKVAASKAARYFFSEDQLPAGLSAPVAGDEDEWHEWQAVGDPVMHIELRRSGYLQAWCKSKPQITTIIVVLKCIVTQQLLPFAASAPSPGAKVQAN